MNRKIKIATAAFPSYLRLSLFTRKGQKRTGVEASHPDQPDLGAPMQK
jgi:hypothetical protein